MRKYCVAIVCGTRPEIVKLAPVYRALAADHRLEVHWIHTGQHGDMARDMLRCFDIVPHFQLTRNGTTLEEFSSGCRTQLDALRASGKWDACIVQGDTESAFLGALSAFYGRIPVLHVEAGLRTNNLRGPFPEEGIRQMISRIASLHFAPTARAKTALLAEGVAAGQVVITGNTVVDAQQWVCARYGIAREPAQAGHILVTAHRREHWGSDMERTFRAVADIAAAHPGRRILFPVHLNPVIGRPAQAILGRLPNVSLLPPLDYLAMQNALANADLLLTDSGGLQEEAPTFGVPTVVLRRETERPEAVDAGCAWLVGPEREDIVAAATRLLRDRSASDAMRKGGNPFGDGRAAERIALGVERLLGIEDVPSKRRVHAARGALSSAAPMGMRLGLAATAGAKARPSAHP
jgi:UDP-N-acetylglucosamine 2-epimerase (non-hydrolysing)